VSFSVIVPSKSATNISACLTAIWTHEPKCHVVVVDDGIEWVKVEQKVRGLLTIVEGVKPFIFSRAINAGIKAAGEREGYIICNDDAILMSPGGFTTLLEASRANPQYGIISATTNVSGNRNQRPKGIGFREETNNVPFVCAFIPRRTIEMVGYLDEAFTAYGYEDDDMCERVRRAGLKIGIHDGCFLDHGSLHSSYRGKSKQNPKETNEELYKRKWK
jgi:GT2 family glycosyltransferase